jgi:hypothetical protein
MGTVDPHKYRKLRASTPRVHLLPPTSFLQKPLCTMMEDKSRHLLGGPLSTSSSTSVVAAAGATDGPSQGPRHRRLIQLQCCCRSYRQHLPGGPPSTSSLTLVVAASGATSNTQWGPAIDVFFNLGGGCYRSYRQHPQGGEPLMFG